MTVAVNQGGYGLRYTYGIHSGEILAILRNAWKTAHMILSMKLVPGRLGLSMELGNL